VHQRPIRCRWRYFDRFQSLDQFCCCCILLICCSWSFIIIFIHMPVHTTPRCMCTAVRVTLQERLSVCVCRRGFIMDDFQLYTAKTQVLSCASMHRRGPVLISDIVVMLVPAHPWPWPWPWPWHMCWMLRHYERSNDWLPLSQTVLWYSRWYGACDVPCHTMPCGHWYGH